LPGIFYRIREGKGKALFFWLNMVLAVLLFIGSFWYFFHVDQVVSSSLNDTEKYILIGISIFGSVFLAVFNVLMRLSKKYQEKGTRILFIVSFMYLLTSIVLTPIWLYIMNPGIPFFVRIPLRIVKMPVEVTFYVVLLAVLLRTAELITAKDRKKRTE